MRPLFLTSCAPFPGVGGAECVPGVDRGWSLARALSLSLARARALSLSLSIYLPVTLSLSLSLSCSLSHTLSLSQVSEVRSVSPEWIGAVDWEKDAM